MASARDPRSPKPFGRGICLKRIVCIQPAAKFPSRVCKVRRSYPTAIHDSQGTLSRPPVVKTCTLAFAAACFEYNYRIAKLTPVQMVSAKKHVPIVKKRTLFSIRPSSLSLPGRTTHTKLEVQDDHYGEIYRQRDETGHRKRFDV